MTHDIMSQSFNNLNDENQQFLIKVVELLENAYFAEIETVINYISIFNNLKGIKSEPVKNILKNEIQDGFRHAQEIANRIRILGFIVPSSKLFRESALSDGQKKISTNNGNLLDSTMQSIVAIEAEAINIYKEIIDMTAEKDPGTADLATTLLRDEEDHYRTFSRFI